MFILLAVLVIAALFKIMSRLVKIGCFLLLLALLAFLIITFGHRLGI
jgi:hypothetical protein